MMQNLVKSDLSQLQLPCILALYRYYQKVLVQPVCSTCSEHIVVILLELVQRKADWWFTSCRKKLVFSPCALKQSQRYNSLANLINFGVWSTSHCRSCHPTTSVWRCQLLGVWSPPQTLRHPVEQLVGAKNFVGKSCVEYDFWREHMINCGYIIHVIQLIRGRDGLASLFLFWWFLFLRFLLGCSSPLLVSPWFTLFISWVPLSPNISPSFLFWQSSTMFDQSCPIISHFFPLNPAWFWFLVSVVAVCLHSELGFRGLHILLLAPACGQWLWRGSGTSSFTGGRWWGQ